VKSLKLLCLLLILTLAGCGNDNYQSSLNSVNQPQSTLLQELSAATKTAINSSTVSPSDAQKNSVIKLFQSMFNASPGADLLNLCSQWLADGMTETELANLIASTDLFKIDSLYPTYLSNYDFLRRHLNLLMGTTVSDSNKHALALVMQSLLDGGWTRGEVMLTLVNLLLDIPASEPSWGVAAEQLRNKLEVSYYYSATKGLSSNDIGQLQSVTAYVTNDISTVKSAKYLIDGNQPPMIINFEVSSGYNSMLLTWAQVDDSIKGNIEVWRSKSNDLSNATKIGRVDTSSSMYSDVPPRSSGYSESFYYWVRIVTDTNIEGPFNSVTGTVGRTADNPSYILCVMNSRITGSDPNKCTW